MEKQSHSKTHPISQHPKITDMGHIIIHKKNSNRIHLIRKIDDGIKVLTPYEAVLQSANTYTDSMADELRLLIQEAKDWAVVGWVL